MNETTKQILNHYKIAVEHSSLVSKTDANGIIIYVNDKFCEISGYKEGELLGQNHNIVKSDTTPTKVYTDLWNTIKVNQETWNGIITNKAKDGTLYTVDATILPVFNNFNNQVEYIAIRKDITEQVAYKQILEASLPANNKYTLNEKIALIKVYDDIFSSTVPQFKFSLDGTITSINTKALDTLNRSYDYMIGKKFYFTHKKNKSNPNPFVILKDLMNFEPWSGLIEHISSNGDSLYLNTTISPVVIDNKIIEYMVILNDITATIKANKEMQDVQQDIIFTLGSIGESRNRETANHVKRVSMYSCLLGRLYGLSEDEIILIKTASPMHDIGNISVPDEILNKKGILNDIEKIEMQKHTTLGHNMLNNSTLEVLQVSAIIANTHHEKYDGSGYPSNSKAEDIHIYGRITALADVFDVLASDRVYKKAWPIDDVIEHIKEQSGKHFDPKLVDLLIENIDQFIEIKDLYKD